MKSRRIDEMTRYINEHGFVGMEELQTAFGVSINTVRRDVAEMVSAGLAQKVYGGVRSHAPSLLPYEVRSYDGSHQKPLIGRRAAELVEDGDIIFIDSGTTTLWMMQALKEKKGITILTNNIEIVVRAMDDPGIRLIVLPGELNRKTHSLIGDETVSVLKRFNIHKAFMAATGVSESGVTNSSPQEYEIKRTAVERSSQTCLMVTGDKFGVTSLLTYASLRDIQTVITDHTIPEAYRTLLDSQGIRCIEADTE